MRVRVYEHLTATGDDDGSSMFGEGRAMREALLADLHQVSEFRVVEDHADCAIVIAPETDGILERIVAEFRRTQIVAASSPQTLALTRDKLALAEHWRAAGVRTPVTHLLSESPTIRWPVVVKPRDGAGSCDTQLITQDTNPFDTKPDGEFLIQEFVPGRAASVAFLVGPEQTIPLQPTFQTLSDDGRFHYLGGELPIPHDLAMRATKLATRAVECVPGLAGYVGVDLILGGAGDGSDDYAIEINPRLTTSYIGLRGLADFNMAEAILRVFLGTEPPEIRWKSGRVSFTADGRVKTSAT